jgi:fused signal recognition particle receptor
LQAQELRQLAQQRLEEEQRAAAESEAANWEAVRHQRQVQLLLERSEELRGLKEKLQAAEVNLERAQQQQQRAAIHAREREYAAALEALAAQQREAGRAREAAEAEQRAWAEQEAREALAKQMRERSELQRVAKVGAAQAPQSAVSKLCGEYFKLRCSMPPQPPHLEPTGAGRV